MSGLDLQASMNNLIQMDRHQHDSHRIPVVYQDTNAAIARAAALRRLAMPVQPDALEQKDPDARQTKREYLYRKRRRKRDTHKRRKPPLDGGFVDCNA